MTVPTWKAAHVTEAETDIGVLLGQLCALQSRRSWGDEGTTGSTNRAITTYAAMAA